MATASLQILQSSLNTLAVRGDLMDQFAESSRAITKMVHPYIVQKTGVDVSDYEATMRDPLFTRLTSHFGMPGETLNGMMMIFQYRVQKPYVEQGMTAGVMEGINHYQESFFTKPSQLSRKKGWVEGSYESTEKAGMALERVSRELRIFIEANKCIIAPEDFKKLIENLDIFDAVRQQMEEFAILARDYFNSQPAAQAAPVCAPG